MTDDGLDWKTFEREFYQVEEFKFWYGGDYGRHPRPRK